MVLLRGIILVLLLVSVAAAEGRSPQRGLWPLAEVPWNAIEADTGHKLDLVWRTNVQGAVVLLMKDGQCFGTGSFVSGDGLVVTTRDVGSHVAGAQRVDLKNTGFLARHPADELPCAGEAWIEAGSRDVTRTTAPLVKQLNIKAAELRAFLDYLGRRVSARNGQTVRIESRYGGEQYFMCQYVRLPLKLVLVPPVDLATPATDDKPGYGVDVAFLRAYRDGAPYTSGMFLRWSTPRCLDGHWLMTAGFPDSTSRMIPLPALRHLRDAVLPIRLPLLRAQAEAMRDLVRIDEYADYGALGLHFRLSGEISRQSALLDLLRDKNWMSGREKMEQQLLKAAGQQPETKALLAEVYAQNEADLEQQRQQGPASFLLLPRLTVSPLIESMSGIADALEGAAPENPTDQRFAVRNFISSHYMGGDAKAINVAILAAWFAKAQELLPEEDNLVSRILEGRTPLEAAREIINASHFGTQTDAQDLLDLSPDQLRKLDDPLVALFKRLRSAVGDRDRVIEAELAHRFARVFYRSGAARFMPPEGRQSLRLGWGRVEGYRVGERRVPCHTTFNDLRRLSTRARETVALPPRLQAAEGLDWTTPLNGLAAIDAGAFVYGMPLITHDAELTGIITGSNGPAKASIWAPIDQITHGRVSFVHAAAIEQVLQHAFDAGRLVEELHSGRMPEGNAAVDLGDLPPGGKLVALLPPSAMPWEFKEQALPASLTLPAAPAPAPQSWDKRDFLGLTLDDVAVLQNGTMAAASTNGLIFVGDRVDIWVGRYENREGRMIGNAPLPGIGTLAVKMHRGELLIGCSQGIGGLSNGKLWSAGKPEGAARDYRYNCQAILPLRDGRIAVGGRCGTVALVDRQARMTRTLHTGLGVNVWVSDFAIDEKGRLWIAMCGSGVWVFDGERLVSYGPKHEWVPSERVYAVAFDAEGALWVGSGSNGVARRLPDGSTELFDQNNGPIAQGAYGIWLDDEERVWVARSHDGLVVWSNGRWKYPVFENCSFTVGKAMPTDAGRWWVSSSARLALTGPPEWHDEPPGNEYTHERIAAEWPGPFPERVKSVVDGSGRTYVRCDDGVWRFDGETWEPLQEVLKASATVLHVDRRKRVWIGTVLQGLVRFDEHGTAVFLRDPGKMKSRIDAVADADVGGVFVGTGYGIWHIPEGGNEAVIIKDGMSVPWIVRDADGRQYCASTYFGAYLLDGKKAVRAEPKAGHALIDFYVNDKGQAEGLSSETTAKGVEAVRFVLDGTEVHVVEGPEPTAAE